MEQVELENLMAKVADLGRVSEAEARRIVNEVYDDGVVSRAEADALFDLNDQLSGSDKLWDDRFREAIKDYLLTVEAPVGWVTDEECQWLIDRISADGRIGLATELDLLLDVLRYAEGAPRELGIFTLQAICDYAKAEAHIDDTTVERLRRALYAPAGDGAGWVTRAEAACLFELNDTVGRAKNDPSWNDLFARAIGNHLMAAAHPAPTTEQEALSREKWLKEKSGGLAGFFGNAAKSMADGSWFDKIAYDPEKARRAKRAAQDAVNRAGAVIDAEEEDWLVNRLGWEKDINAAERALINFLKKEAPGFTIGIVEAA